MLHFLYSLVQWPVRCRVSDKTGSNCNGGHSFRQCQHTMWECPFRSKSIGHNMFLKGILSSINYSPQIYPSPYPFHLLMFTLCRSYRYYVNWRHRENNYKIITNYASGGLQRCHVVMLPGGKYIYVSMKEFNKVLFPSKYQWERKD